MVNFKIYQAYFDNSQLQYLDPEFTPLDNTDNLQPELREYPLFLKCRDRAVQDGVNMWGYMSWKWKQKLKNVSAQFVIDRVKNNPDYDVYFFNYYNAIPYYNVWEQGAYRHTHMMDIMECIFPLMGIDPSVLYQPMNNNVSFYALYCIGNKTWWDGLIEFTTRFISAVDKLPDNIKLLYNQSAGYEIKSLNYFSFIHERLLSTYLWLNQHRLKVLPYHDTTISPVDSMLEDIKSTAIQTAAVSTSDAWFRLRNSYYPQFRNNWSAKILNFQSFLNEH